MSFASPAIVHRHAFVVPPSASRSSRRRRPLGANSSTLSAKKMYSDVLAVVASGGASDAERFDGKGGTNVQLPERTWNSPTWNWGSARGDAHDAAQVRVRFCHFHPHPPPGPYSPAGTPREFIKC